MEKKRENWLYDGHPIPAEIAEPLYAEEQGREQRCKEHMAAIDQEAQRRAVMIAPVKMRLKRLRRRP